MSKIHPYFSVVFLVIIYLSIGPLFAIPRTASTSFEMTVMPIVNFNDAISLFVFSMLHFILVLYLCLNPGGNSRSYWLLNNTHITYRNYYVDNQRFYRFWKPTAKHSK